MLLVSGGLISSRDLHAQSLVCLTCSKLLLNYLLIMKYLAIVNPVTALFWLVHCSTSTIHDGGKKFEEIKFHVFPGQMLSATTSGVAQNTIKVRDKKDCVVSCPDVPWCRSVNVKITPESDGLHVCELISVDNFTNHKDLKNNANFVHYSMKVFFCFLLSQAITTATEKIKANLSREDMESFLAP